MPGDNVRVCSKTGKVTRGIIEAVSASLRPHSYEILYWLNLGSDGATLSDVYLGLLKMLPH
jgi:hypothetical protein